MDPEEIVTSSEAGVGGDWGRVDYIALSGREFFYWGYFTQGAALGLVILALRAGKTCTDEHGQCGLGGLSGRGGHKNPLGINCILSIVSCIMTK